MPDEKLGLQVEVKGLKKFTSDMDKANKSVDDTAKAFDDVTPAAKKGGGALEDAGQQFFALNNIVQGVNMAVNAFHQVFEFGKEGAQILRLEESGTELAASFGMNMDQLVSKLDEAALGTVANADIISAANRAMMLGVGQDMDQLAKLMEVAALRGRAMGLSTTQAFNDIVTGVGRMSPMILDNLGIIVDSEKTYGTYAKSIGKTASELSSMEKRQALLTAVLADGEKQLRATGGIADDAAAKIERLEASTKNLTDTMKKKFAPVLAEAADALNTMMVWNEKVVDALYEHEDQMINTADTYDEYSAEMKRAAQVAGYLVDAEGDLIKLEMQGELAAEVLAQKNYMLSEAQWEAEHSLRAVRDEMGNIPGAAEGVGEAMEGLEEPTDGATESIEEAGKAAETAAKHFGALELSAKDVGTAFEKGAPGADEAWKMILNTSRAAQMSVEELGTMAQAIGVADARSVQMNQAMMLNIQAWEEGTISTGQMETAVLRAQRSQELYAQATDLETQAADKAAEAEQLRAEGNLEGAAALDEEAAADRQLAGDLHDESKAQMDALLSNAARLKVTMTSKTPTDQLADSMGNLGKQGHSAAGGFDDATAALKRFRAEAAKGIPDVSLGGGSKSPAIPLQTGMFNVPYTGMIASLHAKEMVLPPALAESVRRALSQPQLMGAAGYGGGGGNTYSTQNNVSMTNQATLNNGMDDAMFFDRVQRAMVEALS